MFGELGSKVGHAYGSDCDRRVRFRRFRLEHDRLELDSAVDDGLDLNRRLSCGLELRLGLYRHACALGNRGRGSDFLAGSLLSRLTLFLLAGALLFLTGALALGSFLFGGFDSLGIARTLNSPRVAGTLGFLLCGYEPTRSVVEAVDNRLGGGVGLGQLRRLNWIGGKRLLLGFGLRRLKASLRCLLVKMQCTL